MNISFIGTGKAAFSLARYFQNQENTIKYCFDIDKEKVSKFSLEFSCEIVSLEALANSSDFVFLTVNDNEIYNLWNNILKFINKKGTIFVHCSGAKQGIYNNSNFHLHSIHPAAPLTGNNDLTNICFGLEDAGMHREKIQEFVEKLGNKVFSIPFEKKSEYHLANVFVSNLALSLFEKGVSYLNKCGLKETEAIELLMPLAKENLNNIQKKGILDSVTGPVARGDYEVCKTHLNVTTVDDDQIYRLLSKNILKILGKDEEEFNVNTK